MVTVWFIIAGKKMKYAVQYSVDSVFFKLLTLAPMMPKRVLGIEDFDYWRAYLRPAVDQGIFNRLRTRT